MEETGVRRESMSGEAMEYGETTGSFGRETQGLDCYRQCMDDAWDLQGESLCSEVCGI
jgi:hypothetical protein